MTAQEEREKIGRARSELAKFTPDRPMIVPPFMLEDLQAIPEIADLIDRVVASEPMPGDHLQGETHD